MLRLLSPFVLHSLVDHSLLLSLKSRLHSPIRKAAGWLEETPRGLLNFTYGHICAETRPFIVGTKDLALSAISSSNKRHIVCGNELNGRWINAMGIALRRASSSFWRWVTCFIHSLQLVDKESDQHDAKDSNPEPIA